MRPLTVREVIALSLGCPNRASYWLYRLLCPHQVLVDVVTLVRLVLHAVVQVVIIVHSVAEKESRLLVRHYTLSCLTGLTQETGPATKGTYKEATNDSAQLPFSSLLSGRSLEGQV